MSKHTEITQKIRAMEQGKFQILCIDYLKYTVGGIVHSPGTVDGKEKTRIGHPDIYLKQDDGTYVLAECTTKDDSSTEKFLKKLKADLLECLNFEKLAVAKEKVRLIYLCCNSTIDTAAYENLSQIAASSQIKLVVIGLHELATYFSSAGKSFAKDYLGIAFETGQILTKEKFLLQYRKKNISTPLDNPILGRENELAQLAEQLNIHDAIILSGHGGVGKSKLAIEAIDAFINQNPEYQAYYIFSKSGEITDDLATFLKPDKSYILLIDDANRQLNNLISVLEKIIESEMRIKVIMTVRDYAKQDVIQKCRNFETSKFILRPLSDEVINSIISNDPYGMQKWDINQRIVQISKGNPRLAIMAANLMKSNADISFLSDVTKIYDEYFQTVLDDKKIFKEKSTKQVLGLIAYFYTIDTKENDDRNIIESFGLKVDEFIETAQQLEELEVVEIYDGSVLKISEQVMSTYFFYDSFLRNPVLNFSLLLELYFESHFYRVSDNFIAAINTFGAENIVKKNKDTWLTFWNSIKHSRHLAIQFMKIFGLYFSKELFVLISHYIEITTDSDKTEFTSREFKHSPLHRNQDEILNLLQVFYNSLDEEFQTAVYLAFKYVLKEKESLRILIDHLESELFISKSDIDNDFQRIKFVYRYLFENISTDDVYKYGFYYIMDHLILRPTGRRELYDIDGDSDILKKSVKSLRIAFLEKIDEHYHKERVILFPILLDYVEGKTDLRFPEIDNDQPYILNIINNHLDPKRFSDCYFVQQYCKMIEIKAGGRAIEISIISERFNSQTYQLYSLLSMKYDYNEKLEYEDFIKRKTDLIASTLNIESLEDFVIIIAQMSIIFDSIKHSDNINNGASITIRNILDHNIILGFQCLSYYLEQGNNLGLSGATVFTPVFNAGTENCEKLYSLISRLKFKYGSEWKQDFFFRLPPEFIQLHTIENLLECYKEAKEPTEIFVSHFVKYEEFAPGTLGKILNILVEKREADNDFVYKLSHNFFQESPQLTSKCFSLCKKVYLQQEEMPGNYDHDSKELFVLIKENGDFFLEYIDDYLDEENHTYIKSNKMLNKVWELENCKELVYESLVKITNTRRSRYEHVGCMFFYNLREEYHEVAYEVFFKLTKDFHKDTNILNTVLDTLRNSLKQFSAVIIQQILTLNDDINFFKRLEFHNNHFSTSSNEIWSEVKAKELSGILEAIFTMPNHYKFPFHKKYLQENIDLENKATAWERKYMFRGFR